jgi:hypothetical protein
MTAYKIDNRYVTMVFEKNISPIDYNPFEIETPFGKPVSVGIGDAFEEIEHLRNEQVASPPASEGER